jgi:hypothetical protein
MQLFRRRVSPLKADQLVRDDAPERVRLGYVQLLRRLSKRTPPYYEFSFDTIETGVLFATRRMTLGAAPGGSVQDQLEHFFRTCPWLEFYEAVEAVDRYLAETHPELLQEHRSLADEILCDEGVTLAFGTGDFLRPSIPKEFEDAANAAFANAPPVYADQLRKALSKLSVTRSDPENAIKDAVGALEGVAQEFTGRKGTLQQTAGELRASLHPALVEALLKVYAFRGDVAAHAAKSGIDRSLEAAFVVHVCCAAIQMLTASKARADRPGEPGTGAAEKGFDPDEIPF